MRTIKFRGKKLENGEWLYDDLVKDDRSGYYVYPNDCDGLYVNNKVDTDTIGQFTGIFDKNGKEIYEGDIVRFYSYDTRCINPDCDDFNLIYENYIKKVEDVVSYEDGMFSCDSSPLAWCGYFDLDELRFTLDVSEEDGWRDADGNIIDEHILGIEIIGNIHDNPELMD